MSWVWFTTNPSNNSIIYQLITNIKTNKTSTYYQLTLLKSTLKLIMGDNNAPTFNTIKSTKINFNMGDNNVSSYIGIIPPRNHHIHKQIN